MRRVNSCENERNRIRLTTVNSGNDKKIFGVSLQIGWIQKKEETDYGIPFILVVCFDKSKMPYGV